MESITVLAPIKAGRDEKRDAILRIACQAFLDDGYAATSMSSIAARVGGSKATLYNYFSSKEELFAAVIAEKCLDLHYLMVEAEQHAPDLRGALVRLGEGMLRVILSDEKIAIYRLVTAETGRFPELGRMFYASGPEKGKALLAQYFDEAIRGGKLRAGDTPVMAGHFFDLLKGELHHRKLWNVSPHVTDAEIAENTARAVDVFLAAYGA